MDLIASQRITAVIYVAARLRVADFLAAGPQASHELAQRTGAHEPSLRRLLRALVALGICKQVGGEQFELTAMGGHLVDTVSQSLKALVLFEGEMLLRSWGGLFESIRSGKNAGELAGVDNSFELMARNPESVTTFNEAMVAYTRMAARRVGGL